MFEHFIYHPERFYNYLTSIHNKKHQDIILDLFVFQICNFFQQQTHKIQEFLHIFMDRLLFQAYADFWAANVLGNDSPLIPLLQKYFSNPAYDEVYEIVQQKFLQLLDFEQVEQKGFVEQIFAICYSTDLPENMPKT